jgi:pantothenate kinase-related protein Tda10
MNNKSIIISGPAGSGKSDLACRIANTYRKSAHINYSDIQSTTELEDLIPEDTDLLIIEGVPTVFLLESDLLFNCGSICISRQNGEAKEIYPDFILIHQT